MTTTATPPTRTTPRLGRQADLGWQVVSYVVAVLLAFAVAGILPSSAPCGIPASYRLCGPALNRGLR